MDYGNLHTFIPDDPAAIFNRIKTNYESLVGKPLLPGQAETLLLQAIGYDFKVLIDQINDAARQQLVGFAEGANLELLAEFFDVYRLPPQFAGTDIRFNIIAGNTGVSIPRGTRVQSADGKMVFQTIGATNVTASVPATFVIVPCEAVTAGDIGNGYSAGLVNNLIDPQPFITSVYNTTESAGGSDAETDEQLRERVKLAPSQYSNAGSKQAYAFYARSASSAIIDVSVTRPIAGTVEVFPLVTGGATPTNILNAVLAALNDETVRPLSDTVLATSPTAISYSVSIDLVLYNSAVDASVTSAITSAIAAYIDGRKKKLGLDVVKTDLIAICKSVDGVYDATVNLPTTNISVNDSSYAVGGTITLNIASHTNG